MLFVELCLKNQESFRYSPSRSLVQWWLKKFRATGSCVNKKPSGRPRFVNTPENVTAVRFATMRNPRRSVRKQAQALHYRNRVVRNVCARNY